jgi:hypothetical protein
MQRLLSRAKRIDSNTVVASYTKSLQVVATAPSRGRMVLRAFGGVYFQGWR